ncbi:hypothetical protein F4680DRAFT_193128 [Xylaria scruposa]|nr:hypothetical protein F4680DRAFT_193128 [Xylaria scruposa]
MLRLLVSEHLRRPLYVLGAGDLGSKAEAVERHLDKAPARYSCWNAILLISDVFIEKHTMDRLEGNEVVSVFLRLMEYHKGINYNPDN